MLGPGRPPTTHPLSPRPRGPTTWASQGKLTAPWLPGEPQNRRYSPSSGKTPGYWASESGMLCVLGDTVYILVWWGKTNMI